MTPNQMYARLDLRREELGLSKQAVATRAKMKRPNVTVILSRITPANKSNPPDVRLSTLYDLATALRLTVELLTPDELEALKAYRLTRPRAEKGK